MSFPDLHKTDAKQKPGEIHIYLATLIGLKKYHIPIVGSKKTPLWLFINTGVHRARRERFGENPFVLCFGSLRHHKDRRRRPWHKKDIVIDLLGASAIGTPRFPSFRGTRCMLLYSQGRRLSGHQEQPVFHCPFFGRTSPG
jgi:hypothetical protein